MSVGSSVTVQQGVEDAVKLGVGEGVLVGLTVVKTGVSTTFFLYQLDLVL